jgi:hypothetical protein
MLYDFANSSKIGTYNDRQSNTCNSAESLFDRDLSFLKPSATLIMNTNATLTSGNYVDISPAKDAHLYSISLTLFVFKKRILH